MNATTWSGANDLGGDSFSRTTFRGGHRPLEGRKAAVRAAHQREARVALHRRHQVPGLRRPIDQIAFPVSNHGTGFHLRRSRVDQALIRHLPSSAPLDARTAPPSLAAGSEQVLPEIAAGLGIGIPVLVDRLLADPPLAFPPCLPGDNLRTSALPKARLGIQAHRLGKTVWDQAAWPVAAPSTASGEDGSHVPQIAE